jgi:archaemetzincin
MKQGIKTAVLPVLLGLYLLAGCKGKQPQSPTEMIGLQPIGSFDQKELLFVQHQLDSFFKVPVRILPAITMRPSWLNRSKGERYSADSIIACLKQMTNDSMPQVVGFTNKDIYTSFLDKNGQIKKPVRKYAVWGIMGLGYCPGRSCVVSNFRLHTPDDAKYWHRLRTVVIHEAGHNLGLPHCPNKGCIMNDTNGSIKTIDNCLNNYCSACREKLKPPQTGPGTFYTFRY